MAIKCIVAAMHHGEVQEPDEAAVARLELRLLLNTGGGSADVEGTHGELRAGFADGLRGDDADRFAQFDHAPGGQVAAVALGANAAPGFARKHGANLDALDARRLNGVGELFGDFLVDLDDDVAFVVFDLVERNAADDAVAQRFDFDARFEDRFDVNALDGAAIDLIDDHVLRHVHEAAREVARIGGLERRIGQVLCARRAWR